MCVPFRKAGRSTGGEIDSSLTPADPEALGSSKWINRRGDWLWRKRVVCVEEGSAVVEEESAAMHVLVPCTYAAGSMAAYPAGSMAMRTGTIPRQMKAGKEQRPKGTTSFTPRAAARFSAARNCSRRSLAAWA